MSDNKAEIEPDSMVKKDGETEREFMTRQYERAGQIHYSRSKSRPMSPDPVVLKNQQRRRDEAKKKMVGFRKKLQEEE